MEEISLREIIEAMIKGKWTIAITVIICVIAVFLGMGLFNPYAGQARTVVSLSFPGVEKGVNPDGSRFDGKDIASPAVIDRALESIEIGSGEMTVADVRANMEIVPVIPDNVVELAQNAIKEGKDFKYYPNEFTLAYNIPKNNWKSLAGRLLGIFNAGGSKQRSMGRKLLEGIIDEYITYFDSLYSERDVLPNLLGTVDYDSYDYPELSSVITSQIKMMEIFLNKKISESKDFRSTVSGYSFKDIQEAMNVIKNVDVSRLASIIGATNLTRDREKLITFYEYRIKLLELEKGKKESESKIALDMMNSFKRENNVLLLPGLTGTGEGLSLEESKSYYDSLAERSTDAGVESKNTEHDIQYYRGEIERLKNDTVSIEAKQKAEKDVLEMLPQIRSKIEFWIKAANDTAGDYYEYKYGKTIRKLTPVEIVSTVNKKLYLAIALVVGIMLGTFLIFIKKYWKESTPAEKQEYLPVESGDKFINGQNL